MFDDTITPPESFSVFTLIEEPVFYYIDKSSSYRDIYLNSVVRAIPPVGNPLDLRSKTKKIFTMMPSSVYHCLIDFAGKVLREVALDPTIELVIDDYALRHPMPGNALYTGLIELLKKNGVKVTVVELEKYDGVIIDNVLLLSGNPVQLNYEKYLFDASLAMVRDKRVKPFRKVFLSRRQMGDRRVSNGSPLLTVQHDNRIDDHEAIEEYFSTLGYEIVLPENFSSLEAQVNFFYETAVLVSTTSSGITNAVFMQEGQTVVELQTPLIVHVPKTLQLAVGDPAVDFSQEMVPVEQLHYFYLKLAFNKKHRFLSINNLSRKTKDIAAAIEGDPYLKSFITREGAPAAKQTKTRSWLSW